ncbi:zinc-dependent alcohol dehydrogenase family protein [Novosphingobium soli]|uniref:Zinc-dependent alcohol dehydrogenase family protein n=1 Tax=Novosphingobium soli TaxID=574956 RepID=A0ABV6CXG9_9SPHN
MARVVRFHAFGGPDVLRVEEVEVPEPAPGEVRVDVAAIGLNRVEAIYRSGGFGPVSLPARIGYEAAGIVEAVGPGTKGVAVGDKVAVLYGLSMEAYGTYADRILYPADRLVRLPPQSSLVEAAASWMQYGTAYALVEVARIAPGDHVVITASSSSVGVAAIQIAHAEGAIPVAVTRGRSKKSQLEAIGASHVIVTDEEDLSSRLGAITGGAGVRVVFDAVGGQQLATLLPAMRPEGIAIFYGLMGGASMEIPLAPVMLANLTLRGWSANAVVDDPERRAALVHYVSGGLESGALRPVIAKTFALQDVAEAHRFMEGNSQVGKIVLVTR